jgi:hypothetical protein
MQEASTLKRLYDSLGDIMDRADMGEMMKSLSTMKRTMDTLVNVPGFVGISDKVAILESRLKEIAVPQLTEAIRQRNGVLNCNLQHIVIYGDAVGLLRFPAELAQFMPLNGHRRVACLIGMPLRVIHTWLVFITVSSCCGAML